MIDRSEEIKTISKRLPSLDHILVVEYISSNKDIYNFPNFDTVFQSDTLESYVLCEFNDPLYIVFSSGTTGKPKCITHSIGGVLIQHAKEHLIHIKLSEKLGIRAQLFDKEKMLLVDDFISLNDDNATHVLNAVSPAFTSSFSLADLIINNSRVLIQ